MSQNINQKFVKKIFFACDHAGFELKNSLIKSLKNQNYQIQDLGCDSSEISVDYPDFAKKMAQEIQKNDFGVLICGSGIGISIAANRNKNIRAALCTDEEMARLSRLHNDANVICFGARLIDENVAKKSLEVFLNTEFEGQRHEARVKKIS